MYQFIYINIMKMTLEVEGNEFLQTARFKNFVIEMYTMVTIKPYQILNSK